MENYANLLATIAANIYQNNNNEVTADMVKAALNAMVASLGTGYQCLGVADLSTTPPTTPDYKCFYIASTPGTYANFNNLVVNDGEVCIFKYDSAWSKEVTGAASTDAVNDIGKYENNPEWVRVVTDSNGLVLYGAKADGTFWCADSPEFRKIVTFLGGLENNVDTLQKLVDAKVDKVTGLSLINSVFASAQSIIDNPEWLQVATDSNGLVLFGIRTNGTIYEHTKEIAEEQEVEDYVFPSVLFDVWNVFGYNATSDLKEYTREYLNIIYPDRIYITGRSLFDGAGPSKVISNTTRWRALDNNTTLQESIPLSISGNGYKEISGIVNLHTTKNSAAVNKNITLMAIGDSITDSNADFWDKTGNWSYEVFTQELFQMDDVDYMQDEGGAQNSIQCHLIGTRKGFARSITYRGVTIDHSDDCHEGRGGWAVVDYLRHPIDCSYTRGDYDILGLTTAHGEPASAEEIYQLIGTTCWGRYTPDITEASWDRFKGYIGYGNVSWAAATASQKAELLTWATDTIVNNPWNPFYDINAYDPDTNTMFSWATYYSRYKTVENDGVTPLATKGSMYIEGTSVCVPNHIVIALGANDAKFARGQYADAEDIQLLAQLLQSATGAKVMVINTGYPASQIPEYHRNIAQVMDHDTSVRIPIAFRRNKALMTLLGNLQTQIANDIYYCPSFFVQGFDTSRTHKNESLSFDFEYDYSWCNDDVHPGAYSHKQIGYQLYAMIMYLLTL